VKSGVAEEVIFPFWKEIRFTEEIKMMADWGASQI
jgi:hypothetical protein